MSARVESLLVIVGLAAYAAGRPAAQQSGDNSQRQLFRSNVNLVQVDVVVLDENGRVLVTDRRRIRITDNRTRGDLVIR